MIDKLKSCFDKDEKFFKSYKQERKRNQQYDIKESETDTEVMQDEEKESEMNESKRFLNVISNLIKFELISQDYEYYIKILEIYKILSKLNIIQVNEKEFVNFFFKNSLDQLSTMITTIDEKEKNNTTALYKTASIINLS